METVTLSPKYQVVIPLTVRKELALRPGCKLGVFKHRDRVEFLPLPGAKRMRGFLRGMDTNLERDGDRL
jgi:AbrB family looped-hinge helix DNA binding protein